MCYRSSRKHSNGLCMAQYAHMYSLLESLLLCISPCRGSFCFVGDTMYDVRLLQPSAAYLLEHQVMGRPLLPGTVMLESCLSAATTLLTG